MKVRLFAALAVLSVLAILALAFPVSATQASTDREMHYTGTIQRMPLNGTLRGVYKIGAQTVRVNLATLIDQSDGKVKLGAKVKVEGYFLNDGTIRARSLEVLSASSGR